LGVILIVILHICIYIHQSNIYYDFIIPIVSFKNGS